MESRRAFLTSLALAIPAAAASAKESAGIPAFKACERVNPGPTADRFPQVVVQDQNKQKAWFYEELINQKLVLVSFTSVRSEKHYPILDNLVKVQEMLGDRLGDDVHMYTITTRPNKDQPEDLKKLADAHGAKWKFLTGAPDEIRQLLGAFNVHGSINGLSWVGNEKNGRWMTKASRQHPLFIAEAIARLSTGKHHKPFLVDMRSV